MTVMAPGPWTCFFISFNFPRICYPGDPRLGVPLLMLLLALQQLIIALVAGPLEGPIVFNTKCNIHCLIQVWFPWPVRFQPAAPGIYSVRCLPGCTSVMVRFIFKLLV